MTYRCKRCDKELSTKQSLERHLTKKTACTAKDSEHEIAVDVLIEELNKAEPSNALKCPKCSKEFSSRQSKYKHLKFHCKEDPIVASIEERITNLERLIQNLNAHTPGSNSNVHINNGNQINNNITFQVNSYGNERLDHLNSDFLTKCLFSQNNGIKALMKEIHFNPELPENHNIRVLSKKQNLLEKYEDGAWHPCDKNNTLDDMIRKGYKILFTHLAEKSQTLSYDNETVHRNEYVNSYLNKIMRREGNVYFQLRRDLYMMILDGTLYILGR